ncbi:hypothetical protein [Microvirga massiliensis]|uniref:hypothetical protein n=1 Tax=Microvirga massiliensis TaxID=1033741 RepID=UPI000B256087|nr:hypothetical protein [Microvirga massiliensis]
MSKGSTLQTTPVTWRSSALRSRGLPSSLATITVLALASPARADAIDGDWCHDDGRHMSIHGPTIVTPGGTTLQGDYTRHSFQYTAPSNEAGGGQPVSMILRSETRVDVRVGGSGETYQTWHRCTATTS